MPVKAGKLEVRGNFSQVFWLWSLYIYDIDIDSALFNINTKTAQIMWCDEINSWNKNEQVQIEKKGQK